MADKKLGLPIADDYKPSDGELNNFVYLILKSTIGWPMRQCDLAVCLTMAGGADAIIGDTGLSKLASIVCEYAWDHIAGEPDEFDADRLFYHIKPIMLHWYNNSSPTERANIG